MKAKINLVKEAPKPHKIESNYRELQTDKIAGKNVFIAGSRTKLSVALGKDLDRKFRTQIEQILKK